MADASKLGFLGKAQKHISRTKTKVLQSIGKADKSTDEIFDDLVQKTDRQHDMAVHFQKELKSYMIAMRNLSAAANNLFETVKQMYEDDWTNAGGFKQTLQMQESLWCDYLNTVQLSVMEPLNAYISSFHPMKAMVAKRGRKMVDFDNSRHILEALHSAKRKDETKIARAQEELGESRRIFHNLHDELFTELPNFYNKRITFYADTLLELLRCETKLHASIAEASQEVSPTLQQLSDGHLHFHYRPDYKFNRSMSEQEDDQNINGQSGNGISIDSPTTGCSPVITMTTTSPTVTVSMLDGQQQEIGDGAQHPVGAENDHADEGEKAILPVETSLPNADSDADVKRTSLPRNDDARLRDDAQQQSDSCAMDGEEEFNGDESSRSILESNVPAFSEPPNVMYTVKATHKYANEDSDELSFDAGDVIDVVPYDVHGEEQDKGWLMGVKRSDGRKGVFPENFTQSISI